MLRCHHQNDSYIKMFNGESHFKASLIVRVYGWGGGGGGGVGGGEWGDGGWGWGVEGLSHKDSVHKLQGLKTQDSRS